MKCDIKIMASPKRYAYVLNLCRILGLDMDSDVFFDDRPGGGDAAYTSERTWALPFRSDEITHRCVLQDDVLCCKAFQRTLDALVQKKPEAFFSLFCPSVRLKEIYEKSGNTPQLVKIVGGGMYGPAIIIPREHIAKIYDWGREQAGEKRIAHDDVLFGEYALANGIEIYCTTPTVVQHLCPDRSLLGYNNKGKVSKIFSMDCEDVDWQCSEKPKTISLKNSISFYK